nr:DUF551 domain-containing protein [Escherichia coli]
MSERLKTHSKTQKKSADLVSNKLRIGVFQRYQMKCKSVSKKSPRYSQHVIILCDGAFVLYAQYRDGEFFDVVRNGDEFFETQSRNVTDWMPLPEPPQEVRQ